MTEEHKKAIGEYQCSGCVNGPALSCFEKTEFGVGCGKHIAGTIIPPFGYVFLGLPKGFNRLGPKNDMKPFIYDKLEDQWTFNKFNVPVWKYKNEHGHTLVRYLQPRNNNPGLSIFLEDCLDKIDCLEISKEDVDFMS